MLINKRNIPEAYALEWMREEGITQRMISEDTGMS